jgi:DNA-binding MarR family transcriptional regulator
MAERFVDRYLPYVLQRADHLLSERFHRSLAAEGVEASEWRVLAVLLDDGPMVIGALTRATLQPQPTTSHAVARLEQSGLVERSVSPTDSRQRIVTLTASGRRRAVALTSIAERHLAEVLQDAEVADSQTLLADLRALIERLEHPGR